MKSRSTLLLQNLLPHQSSAMLLGFEYEEIVGLDETQVHYIKQGLRRADILNLTPIQIEAYLGLKVHGLTPDLIRLNQWLNTQDHFLALSYLINFKKNPLLSAINYLKNLPPIDIQGIYHGFMPTQTETLRESGKHYLFKNIAKNHLNNIERLYNLSKEQISLAEQLYPWVDSQTIGQHAWLSEMKYHETLIFLMKQKYFLFKDAIEIIQNLNEAQLEGIRMGLSRADVLMLTNTSQMRSLITHKTCKNALFASDFSNATWFNSKEHEETFTSLFIKQELSPHKIFEEMKDLTFEQLSLIKHGMKRNDFELLNSHIQHVLYCYPFHRDMLLPLLKDMPWFNSTLHEETFDRAKGYLWGPAHHCLPSMSDCVTCNGIYTEVLQNLEGLNEDQLKILCTGMLDGQIVKSLSLMQAKILREKNDDEKHAFLDVFLFINAKELDSKKLDPNLYYECFTLLSEKINTVISKIAIDDYSNKNKFTSFILDVLKKATELDILAALKENLTSDIADEAWRASISQIYHLTSDETSDLAAQASQLINELPFFKNPPKKELPAPAIQQQLSSTSRSRIATPSSQPSFWPNLFSCFSFTDPTPISRDNTQPAKQTRYPRPGSKNHEE